MDLRWIFTREWDFSRYRWRKRYARVVSVDANLAATEDLRENVKTAGVEVVSENAHTEEFLKKFTDRPDFVVLDPPRAGLGAETAALLANLGAAEIAYLSCDPSTLARDLAVLTGSERKQKTEVDAGASLRDCGRGIV